MARRGGVSAIVDVNESVKQLEQEIRSLTTQKGSLETNVKELEEQRNKLLTENDNLANKVIVIEKEAKDKADLILKNAEEKIEKANLKEGEIAEKQEEWREKTKQADYLIKSNKGLQENLNKQTILAEERIKKLSSLISLIKENLNNI